MILAVVESKAWLYYYYFMFLNPLFLL